MPRLEDIEYFWETSRDDRVRDHGPLPLRRPATNVIDVGWGFARPPRHIMRFERCVALPLPPDKDGR